MLTPEEAAEYVGCKNVAQFRREVAKGVWSKPKVANSRPQRWSRLDLDRDLDSSRSAGVKSGVDPLLDKLRGLSSHDLR